MKRSDIADKLKEIVEPYVQDKEAFGNISESSDLLSDLKINSAHIVDIILDAEEVFDIEIDDDSAEKMLTVKASIDVIESKLSVQ